MQDYEESRIRHRSRLTTTVSAMVILALLAVSAILLLTVGIQVYKNVVVASEQNFELRTSLSYVATKIRHADTAGCIRVTDVDGQQALVLSEDYYGEELLTYIYYRDGFLMEYPLADGMELELEYGFEIIEVDGFTVAQKDGLISLTARDAAGHQETLALALRSKIGD